MERREFLKAGTLATGGLLLSNAVLGQTETDPLFSFIALADPHLREDRPNEPTGVEKLAKALDAIRAMPVQPAFMLMLGDIHPGRLDTFMGNWPVPVHPVHGNHENATHRQTLRELFASDFSGKDFYAFTHSEYRFLGLCTALVGDHVGHFESENITPKTGQTEWLEQELAQSQDCRGRIIFAHVPPAPENRALGDTLGSVESRYFHQLVQDHKVTACFFGHRHANTLYRAGDTAIYGAPSTNWNYRGKPVGFLHVEVHPAVLKVTFVPSL